MNSLYVTSLEAQSGKTAVALALMEQLAGRLSGVAVFRPVIAENHGADRLIALLTQRYHIPFAPADMYGLTMESARQLLGAGAYDELLSRILERYKSLEARAKFVLCIGTDYSGVSTALEFGFNVQVARNLGAPVLPMMNGRGKETHSLVQAARNLFESLEEKKCDVLAVIVNRVEQGEREALVAAAKRELPNNKPVYVLREEPLLGRPTVHEIAVALEAQVISGNAEWLDGDVQNVKIGAMDLPNFLDHLEEGSLVITPGDRSDIIIGALAAERSTAYPRVAGLVLTGNLHPAPQIQRLIRGLRSSPVPVMVAPQDTLTAAVRVNDVRPSLEVQNRRKLSAVLGIVESSVNIPALLERVAAAESDRVTPLMFQYELLRRAKEPRKHIVLPEGTEERILRAAEIILLRDVCDITLLGSVDEVRQKASDLGLSLERARMIDPHSSDLLPLFAEAYYEARKHKGISREMARDTMEDASYFGTMMVYQGHADGMVSGSVHTTAHTVRPALEFVKTKPGISTVSSCSFMCLADRVLVYADCAIVPEPTSAQLADIATSSADTARSFGIEPRVAMLSYSTGESGSGPDVEKVREATRLVRQRCPDLKIEGPIQYDAAIEPTVAKVKLPGSEVAGTATIFIFPDLSAGNNAYKAVQRAANAVAIGPVLQGLKKPVNDLSRGALVPDIVNTIAITAIQAQTEGSTS